MDIAVVIEKILYKEEALVIPGLGTIMSHYKPASIDHVQGMLYPPSKSLSFREDDKIDGLFFSEYVAECFSLTLTEAQVQVKEFVDKISAALNRREIVIFPNVGRLYRDYEQNLKFLQDNTNFNASSFGLPTIQFYPIHRSKEQAFQEASIPSGPSAPITYPGKAKKVAKRKWRKSLRAAMPMLAGLIVVTAAVGIFFMTQALWEKEESATPIPVKEDVRLNKKPSTSEASVIDLTGKKIDAKALAEKEAREKLIEEAVEAIRDEDGDFNTAIDTEKATYGPNQKECVIIIGAYSQKSGVEKRIEEIIDLGMDVYQDKKKNLNRIGVQFLYEDEYDLKRNLKIVRKKFGKKCWIMKQ